jgi:DNA segregation ATPase FtsK/SpoIIIE-like protein
MTVLGRGVSPTRKRGFLLSEEDLIDRKVDEKGAAYRQTVRLDEALAEEPSSLHGQVAFPVGADVSGRCHWLNVAEPSSCHLLIAGTTGSGKSEFMKAMLAALARRLPPDAVQFVLIDPKRVTFNFTGESPYLLQSPFVRREQLDQCLRIV